MENACDRGSARLHLDEDEDDPSLLLLVVMLVNVLDQLDETTAGDDQN